MRLTAHNPLSIARYSKRAACYDASAQRTMALRLRTIAGLELQPGDVVLDVGAGTGLSFAPLLQAVGSSGRVLAFEQSPDMHALALQRVQKALQALKASRASDASDASEASAADLEQDACTPWSRLWHCRAAAETVQLPAAPDAVLFNYVHDISRKPQAVANFLRQCKPGARIAMAGMKFFPWWTGPLNRVAWLKNRPYNAKAADLWQPWSLVQTQCSGFQRQTTHGGMGYIAVGRLLSRTPAEKGPHP